MKDKHVYSDTSEDKWKRVWVPLEIAMDSLSDIDPYDSKAFARVTRDKNGTYGDLMSASKELSEKRKGNNGGHDPIEEKYYDDFSKKRKGKKHRSQNLSELKSNLDKKGVELEL